MNNVDVKAKAGRKEWIGLAVLVLASLLITIDISVLFLAVPFISEDLKPSSPQQLWIMDIYAFVLAGLLITMGWVGDRIGRRRLLIIGAIVFGVASISAAYSTSPGMLIASRALLGVGAATLTPTVLALIRTMFHDSKQRKAAIAAWSGAMSSGVAVGPIVGGLLLEHFWWGSVFLINVPVMVLLVVLGPFLLPEHRGSARGKLDLFGVALSLAAILPVIYGVKELAVNGYSVLPVLAVAIGVGFGFGFVYRQRTTASPLIDLTLFRYRAFSGSVIVGLMVAVGMMGMSAFTFQFLQLVLGMRPLTAALWGLAVMPLIGIAIGVTTPLSHRVRPGYLIAGGLLLMTAGFVVLTQVTVTSHFLVVLVGSGFLAAGMVASSMLIADIVLTAAPPERAGSAVAISQTANEFGAALGFAILGSVGSAVFHHQMANVKPAGLPPEALRAAQDTLGGTAAIAQRLPQPAGSALFNAGREAFTHGLTATALTGAVVMAVVAVLVAFLLRKVPVNSSPEKKDALEQTALLGS